MTELAPIRLRPLTEADLPVLHSWYQNPALWDHLVGAFQPREEVEAVEYMRAWLTPTATEVRLAVEEVEGRRLVGMTALTPIEPKASKAEFHIFLGEQQDRGRGLGRAATVAMLAYGFESLRLSRILLKVRPTNIAARRLYDDLGFTAAQQSDAQPIAMTLTHEAFRQFQARSATT